VDLTFSPSAPLPRTLAGTQVLFDGEAAALISVAAGRVLAIAPYSLAGKRQTLVQAVFEGVASPPVLTEVRADPGYLSLDGSGTGQAYARNPDGTLNSPQNPAPENSSVTMYLTGTGVVDPACPEGSIAAGETHLSSTPSLIPGFLCGIYQRTVATPPYGPLPKAALQDSALTYSVR
jgi:uncharacterized protein (TIGR03437 family)